MATFGKTSVGAVDNALGVAAIALNTRTLSGAGTVTSLWAYLAGSAAGARVMRLDLYADAAGVPTTRLIQTNEVSIAQSAAAAWVQFTCTNTFLSAGTYWMGTQTDATAGQIIRGDTGTVEFKTSITYPTGGDPWGASSLIGPFNNTDLSVYAEYTPYSATVAWLTA